MRPGPVQVWVADLRLDPARRRELERHLAADERERAARFHRAADRDRFVAARGLLREVLAGRLGVAPGAVSFEPAGEGKPRLAVPDRDLRFNASRSGERAAFALAVAREVGVDVERVRDDLDVDAVARRALSAGELRAWLELPPARRAGAFFAAWARKEAYAKAWGEGLALGLDRIETTPSPERPDRLRVLGRGREEEPWEACDVDAGPGYAAAVVAEGEGWPLEVGSLGGWRG
ncbi:MAG TPA: 4'-phosphopantetheinyl transferase superfamily protein [Solirubrobacteraceae bacterium]|nr:4'-phosphopantetheinyl transferase superfamily protein [Solirubrobacteraceae bacterium]